MVFKDKVARCEPGRWVCSKGGSLLRKRFWERHLPILVFLRGYDLSALLSDVIAGLTIGIAFMPSGMATAALAGLPPQYGLYSSFMGSFVYSVLGSCRSVAPGPTTVVGILLGPLTLKFGADIVFLVTFCSGCCVLLIGLLQLDIVIDFISTPVIAGYLSAAGLSVILSQAPNLIGVAGGGSTFFDYCVNLVENAPDIKLWDTVLSAICLLMMVVLKFLGRYSKVSEKSTRHEKLWRGFLGYLSLGRNVIVVVISTAVVAAVSSEGESPVQVAGEMERGIPQFKPPSFVVTYENRTLGFGEAMTQLSGTVTVPLILIIGLIAAANAFPDGKKVDVTQEMIAVGVSNILGSFVQAVPGSSSCTRASVNNSSGVRTPLAGIFTGFTVLLAMVLLTSSLQYLPKATLAVILLCAIYVFIQIHNDTLKLWRTKKSELIPLYATFLGCLYIGLDYGILIGVAFNMLLLLHDAARPTVEFESKMVDDRSVLLVTPDRSVTYPAAEHVKKAICKAAVHEGTSLLVIVSGYHVNHVDSTAVKVLKSLVREVRLRGQSIVLWDWKQCVITMFENYDKVPADCFRSEETLEQLIAALPADREKEPV